MVAHVNGLQEVNIGKTFREQGVLAEGLLNLLYLLQGFLRKQSCFLFVIDGNFKWNRSTKVFLNEFQIDELVQSALPLGKVSLKVNSDWKELADKYWKELLGLVLISLILLGIGKVALPKQPKNIPDPPSELGKEDNQVLSVLKSYSGQVISQEEMDRIVGIDTIKNQDLRKVRRSRAIKALNDYMIEQHGEPIIQRVRDEQDMRIIRYLIEDTFSSKSTKTPEPMIKSPL